MARNHQFGDFCGNDGLSLSLGIIGSLASNTITVYFNHILGSTVFPRISASPRINAHLLGRNIKQLPPPPSDRCPPSSFTFLNNRNTRKGCFFNSLFINV